MLILSKVVEVRNSTCRITRKVGYSSDPKLTLKKAKNRNYAIPRVV